SSTRVEKNFASDLGQTALARSSSSSWYSSTVDFVPGPEDDGKMLTCRAHNPAMPSIHHTQHSSTHFNVPETSDYADTKGNDGAGHTTSFRSSTTPNNSIDDGIKLHVQYVPQLTVRLGKKLRYSHIREGSDVFLECDVKANPPIIEMGWRFEGKELIPSSENAHGRKRIVIAKHSLVLQNVTRHNRGQYTCTGTNAAGKGESPAFQLRIKYEPRCVPGQRQVYGAAKNEAVRLSCELESDPEEVTFKWKARNAKGKISASSSLFDEDKLLPDSLSQDHHGVVHSEGTRSWLTLVPRTEGDYGMVICWGRNSIGVQKEPCVFTLIPAGPPGPVRNCSVARKSEDSITIACLEGYDGGAEFGQKFYMEVHDSANQNRMLIANVSSIGLPGTPARPLLTAGGLLPSTSYVCTFYAANERGISQPTILVVSTIPKPLTLSAKGSSLLHLLDLGRLNPSKNPVGLSAIIVSLVVVVAVLVLIILHTRRLVKARRFIKGNSGKLSKNKKRALRLAPQGDRIENNEDESAVPLRDSMKEREQILNFKNFAKDIEDDGMCPDIIPGNRFSASPLADTSDTTKLMKRSKVPPSSIILAESSFISKSSSTSASTVFSPLHDIISPINVQNSNGIAAHTSKTTTLWSPRASSADYWRPPNGIARSQIGQDSTKYSGSYSSLGRGSWDFANQQQSRSSLPSSVSYQHIVTLPRRTTVHHSRGDQVTQAVPASWISGLTKNVTFDMTTMSHPYAWIDGKCSLTLSRGTHQSPRGASSEGHQLAATLGNSCPFHGGTAVQTTLHEVPFSASSCMSERASSEAHRRDLHFNRAKLQLLTMAEPQRSALQRTDALTASSTTATTTALTPNITMAITAINTASTALSTEPTTTLTTSIAAASAIATFVSAASATLSTTSRLQQQKVHN
ncbi:hypothetical protein BIW11_08858, partial [Tropilaelaps mercedesae]